MRLIKLSFLTVTVVLGGCVHNDVSTIVPKSEYEVTSPCLVGSICQPSNRFRAVTFNAGLAPGVQRLVNQRYPEVARQVAKEVSRSDLVCLQEVWTEESRETIINAVGLPSDNVFWSDTRGLGKNDVDRCSARQARGISKCVQSECSDEESEDMAICARKKCFRFLAWLYLTGRPCLRCLTTTVGQSSDEAYQTCVNGPGSSRAYGGENGVIILSRHPLQNRQVVVLPASGTNRVALMATVVTDSGVEVEVACTHLSSSFGEMKPLDSEFGSWEDEQAAQLKIIDQQLTVRSKGERPQLLIGDMNFSREHGLVMSEMPASWNLAVERGFDSPAAQAEPPLCSLCSDNPFNPTKKPRLIDHVLLRQAFRDLKPLCAERAFDQPITVMDRYGQPATTGLSDHFGTAVGFCTVP